LATSQFLITGWDKAGFAEQKGRFFSKFLKKNILHDILKSYPQVENKTKYIRSI